WSDGRDYFMEIVRDLRLVAYKEAEPGNEAAFVAVPRDSTRTASRGVCTHWSKAADRNHTRDAFIEGSGIEPNHAAHRVSKDRNSLGVYVAVLLKRIDRGARIFHHAAHLRPMGVAIVETRKLAHTATESALIVREHRIAGLNQR